MFAIVALNPDVSDISAINDKTRNDLNKKMGVLVQRLITESCREQTIEAVKNEGNGVFKTSFEVLGQVAAQSMLSHPAVNKGAETFTQHLDKKMFEQLGVPTK